MAQYACDNVSNNKNWIYKDHAHETLFWSNLVVHHSSIIMGNPTYNEVKHFKDIKTKTESQLEATKPLYKAFHWLNDTKTVLEVYAELWDDKVSMHRNLSDFARNICKSIVLTISKIAVALNQYGKSYNLQLPWSKVDGGYCRPT